MPGVFAEQPRQVASADARDLRQLRHIRSRAGSPQAYGCEMPATATVAERCRPECRHGAPLYRNSRPRARRSVRTAKIQDFKVVENQHAWHDQAVPRLPACLVKFRFVRTKHLLVIKR